MHTKAQVRLQGHWGAGVHLPRGTLSVCACICLWLCWLLISCVWPSGCAVCVSGVAVRAALCSMTTAPAAIHWFRKGLRLHDNPALLDACVHASKASQSRSARFCTHAHSMLLQVYPVFVLDPHFAKAQYVGQLRYAFLLETLSNLDDNLKVSACCLASHRGRTAPRHRLSGRGCTCAAGLLHK
jgi:hypothetical protein